MLASWARTRRRAVAGLLPLAGERVEGEAVEPEQLLALRLDAGRSGSASGSGTSVASARSRGSTRWISPRRTHAACSISGRSSVTGERVAGEALEPGPIGQPRGQQRLRRLDADLREHGAHARAASSARRSARRPARWGRPIRRAAPRAAPCSRRSRRGTRRGSCGRASASPRRSASAAATTAPSVRPAAAGAGTARRSPSSRGSRRRPRTAAAARA